MSEKKNIDRLFQEKFKEFDVAPPEYVWQNIEAELQKDKKKKRVIPLWFRLSGVAALLIIGLMLTAPLFTGVDIDADKTPVVIESTNKREQDPAKIAPVADPVRRNEVVNDAATGVATTPADNNDGNAIQPGQTKNSSNRKVIIRTNNPLPRGSAANAVATQGNDNDSGTRAAGTNNSRSNPTLQNSQNRNNSNRATPDFSVNESAVATRGANQSNTANGKNGNNTSGALSNNQETNGRPENNTSGRITPDSGIAAVNASGEGTADKKGGSTGNNTNVSPDANPAIIVPEGGVNTTEVAVNETAADTTATPKAEENILEKMLEEKLKGIEKDKTEVAEGNKQRWNIKPQMAPVFFNTLSDGSPIDSQFAGNSKSFDNDISYGLGVNYAVTDKIAIRTGVNTVNMSYSTNDIQFYAALNQQTPNVAARGVRANIVVENEGTSVGGFDNQIPTQKFNGSLVQKMGYIEVPLEMSYKLLDRKFGINVIGGVSTLFLNENNVSVISSQGYRSEVGQAENLNNVHFSTNIGIGFKYRFWKAFEANFEPTFKYQLNAFSNNSGNFRPYFVGLYSGISFSF